MRFRRLVLLVSIVAAIAPPAAALPGAPDVEGPDRPAATGATIVPVFDNESFTCTEAVRTKTVPIPAGDWNRVLLEFTSVPDGDPWDRLFGVAIGGVEVLRGTTPRTSFTLRKDVTEYARLLPPGGTADVSLFMGSYVGALRGSVTLELYAGEPTAALSRKPGEAVPAFAFRSLTGRGSSIDAPVAFGGSAPASAVVELTMSGHSHEEFWYQRSPAARRLFHVFVDDREVATFVPMPYVYALAGFGNDNANTTCVGPGTSDEGDALHPLMWWTAQRALDAAGVHTGDGEIPPYHALIAPDDLALLAGARTVRIVQEGGFDRWVTSLSFLLQR